MSGQNSIDNSPHLPSPRQRLSLIISAYNEEEALPQLFAEIRRELVGWEVLEVIIVNDGSTDRTAEVMSELEADLEAERTEESDPSVKLILYSLDHNSGMGAALKAGYHLASEPWVTFLPGDGQIVPAMIYPICDAAERGARVVTTRYTNRQYSLYRKILSHGLRVLNRLIVGVDVTSEGMYLIERDLLQAMPLASDSFMLNLEIPIRAARHKLPMEVVGIEVRERQGGQSSATRWGRIVSTLIDLIALRWRMMNERSS